MKVIAALNGLITSEIAARYALHYAGLHGFTLTLLHVLNPDDIRDDVEKSMTVIEKAAGETNCRTERVFLQGKPVATIRAFLHETRADTLFCSTRMRRHFFENSISERLAASDLPVDLAVVRAVHVDHISSVSSIILPIRESRLSVRKFTFFASLARIYLASGEIYSVAVADKGKMAAMEIKGIRRLFQKINTRLSHYLKLGSYMNIPMRIKHAVSENEVNEVLHHLADHNFQLMVIGGRRHGRFSRLFGEKPIERLFRSTPVNTIAFYARDQK